ncbi:MAG: peptide deformylase [Patescibacteria group bacterium]|nr:peptide deformylase [Patescibacteria group bacterium]
MSLREPKILKRTEFGNPILQNKSSQLSKDEIKSEETQQLIADMRYTVSVKKYGVGIAAPQVGRPIALSVIYIKRTPSRPNSKEFNQVIINPSYEGLGKQEEMWEGCMSLSSVQSPIFAKALRYKRIRATWLDEYAEEHNEDLDGLVAHVFQHETDHLKGVLFPERVKDHKSWMNASEYKKMMLAKNKKKAD